MTMPREWLGHGGHSDYVIINVRNDMIVVCLIAGSLGRKENDVAARFLHLTLLVLSPLSWDSFTADVSDLILRLASLSALDQNGQLPSLGLVRWCAAVTPNEPGGMFLFEGGS